MIIQRDIDYAYYAKTNKLFDLQALKGRYNIA
jgi:hypothetical protein